jgi:hypothetical protein
MMRGADPIFRTEKIEKQGGMQGAMVMGEKILQAKNDHFCFIEVVYLLGRKPL